MHRALRKVQGKQWYLTLVQEWRDQHKIQRSDSLEIFYGDHSVFVANPQNRNLSVIEQELINLLVTLPSMKEGENILERMKIIIATLEGHPPELIKVVEG